ncbi:hypothetical protein [Cognataquiflexum rubidum]|uniref:hypothetical protein n=1 Tax=Cognataquiflexum rubidum TaxID=2922273 RepID=UPI001F137B72|nr:hypothetical protein [Cognataquiflexum rubidum]MCH6234206.1 hypothetical protein [Cognataquiflexum rubidum]
MENSQKYLPVNWVDGMKLNKNHFIKENLAQMDSLSKSVASQLHPYNYGILPNWGKNQDIKITITTDNQNEAKVRISSFNAITRGGYLIELDYETIIGGYLSLVLPKIERKAESNFWLILRVNPFERTGFGNTDIEELPPRLPSSLPTYSLHLLPQSEGKPWVVGNADLPIGRLQYLDGNYSIDDNYIPPCSAVSSHSSLLELHADMEKLLGKLEIASIQILRKIILKKQQNDMAFIVQKVCEQLSSFTAIHAGSFGISKLFQPPVFLIESFIALSRLIKNNLDIFEGCGKEELLNYLNESCDVRKGELEAQLSLISNLNYNHQDISFSVEKITFFSKYIDKLFANMLKLEYIGKRKDAGIFVKEHQHSKEPSSPTGDYQSAEEEPIARKRKSFFVE